MLIPHQRMSERIVWHIIVAPIRATWTRAQDAGHAPDIQRGRLERGDPGFFFLCASPTTGIVGSHENSALPHVVVVGTGSRPYFAHFTWLHVWYDTCLAHV